MFKEIKYKLIMTAIIFNFLDNSTNGNGQSHDLLFKKEKEEGCCSNGHQRSVFLLTF